MINNPLRYGDPTGHCFDGIITAICVGALIGIGFNLYDQYQRNGGSFKEINLGEVVVAGAVGVVGGLVGAAIIAPAATAFGTGMAVTTGSAALGVVAEYAAGGFMAGTANVLLSNAERTAKRTVNGEQVTARNIKADFYENYEKDMFYGALGYGASKALGNFGKKFWTPSETIGNPNISQGYNGVGELLHPAYTQKIIVGAGLAISEAASNSSLLRRSTEKKILRMEKLFNY